MTTTKTELEIGPIRLTGWKVWAVVFFAFFCFALFFSFFGMAVAIVVRGCA